MIGVILVALISIGLNLYVCLVIKPCLCDWCSGHNAKSRLPLAIDSAKLTTSSGLRDNSSARLLGPVTGLPVVGLQRLRRARRHESFEGSLFTSPITRNRLAKEVGRRKWNAAREKGFHRANRRKRKLWLLEPARFLEPPLAFIF